MKLKEIKGENVVVHCKSRIEAETLVKHTESEQKYEACWLKYGENTCFRFLNGKIEGFTDVDYYRESGYEIIEFADLVLPELNAEEVLEICHEICKETLCSECVMKDACFAKKESNFEKVVEICAKWKADHEKKEPKVEWVYRVFGAENYGEKFFQTEDEAILRCEELAKSQKTRQYARYERVCRVKE